MNKIKFTDIEKDLIEVYGELCPAVAQKAMERSHLNFDDVEHINNHYESHEWGSNADRKYRKSAINKAVMKVAQNPLQYAEEVQR